MPTQSTLTSPLGTPVYAPDRDDRDRELYVSPSRAGRLVPLVVGGIGAGIIALGAILYAAGVIGAPVLSSTEEVATEPAWQPNPAFEQTLGVQALMHLRDVDRRQQASSQGSLLPKQPPAPQPGITVSPPRPIDSPNDSPSDREIWEPPVQPKPPEGEKPPPKAADPQRTPPNGYAY